MPDRHVEDSETANQRKSGRSLQKTARLRILHGPVEVAGVAGTLVRALRRRGNKAELAVMVPPPFCMPCDRLLTGYRQRAVEGFRAPLRHDVIHFHFNTTFCEYLDAAWGKVVGRPLMVMHFHGDDCRRREVTFVNHPARARIYDASQRNERLTLRRTRLAGRLCRAAIVADLELLEHVAPFFDRVYVVPAPVELPSPPATLTALPGEGPVVFHAPSNSAIKGTEQIVEAIDAIAARQPLRRRLVSGISHEEVLAEIARADIVVDQMNSQTPGIFALEAMALGKPVLCEHDRRALAGFAQGTPLVKVTPETLVKVLRELCEDEGARRRLGLQGYEYVRAVHDADRVAGAMEAVYGHAQTEAIGVFEATADGIRLLEERAK